jgi:D-amino peptidase
VVVVDGHGPGAMNREILHPRAKLLSGRPWPPDLRNFGIDGAFAATMMVGQHAKSNTDGGHICHTMSFSVEDYTLNGISVGETGLWMLIAGYFNVPVIMLSGDQAACEEAHALVPNIEVAAVKWGMKRGSASGRTKEENAAFNAAAIHLHPDEARALIREHAARAVRRIPEIAPFRLEAPYALTMAYRPLAGKSQGEVIKMKAADLMDLIAQRKKTAEAAAAKTRARSAAVPAQRKPAPVPRKRAARKAPKKR